MKTRRVDISTPDLTTGGGLLQAEQTRRCPPGSRWDVDKGMCVVEEVFDTAKGAHSCGPDQRFDGALGRCVAKELTEGWSPEKALFALKEEINHRRDMKNRIRQEPDVGLTSLGNRQVDEREDADPFLFFELLMAQELAQQAFAVADADILPLYDEQVLPEDPVFFDDAKLKAANEEASSIWENVIITASLTATVATLLRRSLTAGEATVAPGILQGVPSVERVLQQMQSTVTWNTNQFFNQQVMPAINRSVTNMFANTAALEQPNLDTIRRVLDRRLKSVPYWRVVANANASRAFHYGMLKAAQFQGFTGYKFVAILDERTSDICRELDGRSWHLADAVNLMDSLAGSDDPDAAKTIMPWVKVEDVRGLSNDALRDKGVMVPPLHGNCRSTIVPV